MSLDITARRNLELTERQHDKSKRGTLLWVLDKTSTSMGGRLLRKWIGEPLLDISEIKKLGAIISMNSSFYLKKGLFKKRKYYRLLKKNLIDIITSDAHRAEDYRVFYDCYNFLVKKSGRNKADMLFYQNACNLFETSDLHSAEPYDTK